MSVPTISLVIPVFERPEDIRRCLEGVSALDYPQDLLQIIVVDNNSQDTTPEVVREMGFACVVETTPGAAAARNCGINLAENEIIAFLDSDCVPEPDWLKELVQPFESPEISGVGGNVVGAPAQNVYEEYMEQNEILCQENFINHPGQFFLPFIITANAAYRRNLIQKIGGFDEWFSVNAEDADLAWRAQWEKGQLDYCDKAKVIHTHRNNLKSLFKVFYSYGAGTVYLLKRHGNRLGQRSTFSFPMYRMWLSALIKMPFMILFGSNEYNRKKAFLDWVHATAHLSARWIYSIKLGVLCL